ncbi:hypothetical protein TNCT_154401 [Trichonephila clavata]|uniref:Uncharacterized protein n=1 Tax=Trichonephila clavata TaxID=2740835 RepID=A0A8X6KGN1_TRICU|nr:hypothetical protein TNCT_154401 [Trichonephila clavata]
MKLREDPRGVISGGRGKCHSRASPCPQHSNEQALSGRSSPCPQHRDSQRQALPGRSSPYQLRSKGHTNERRAVQKIKSLLLYVMAKL